MATGAKWRAGANVLVAANDAPRLWLDGDRQLRDSLGVVKKFDTDHLAPSTIIMSDEDEASFISDGFDNRHTA